MKKRFRVTFTTEIELPRPFINDKGEPEIQLLLKQAAYKISRNLEKKGTGSVAYTYVELGPKPVDQAENLLEFDRSDPNPRS